MTKIKLIEQIRSIEEHLKITSQFDDRRLMRKTKEELVNIYQNLEANLNSSHASLVEELEVLWPIEGLMRPVNNPNFYMPDSLRDLLKLVYLKGQEPGKYVNVLLTGPQGCGKTESVREFAATYNLPLLTINCSLVREARDWFGYKTASNGNVEWVKTQFAEAVQRGGVVICLDEITRVSPPVLNALIGLLDGTRSTFIEETKSVLNVGPMVYFFATANVGSQFSGTFGKLDAALDDRFGAVIKVDFIPEEKEKEILINSTGVDSQVAEKLVKVAQTIRTEVNSNSGGRVKKVISTRTLISAAELYKTLGVDSFDYSFLSRYDGTGGADSEESFIRQTLQAQFGALRA